MNLELSNIQPQQTLFGGFVVDRRETTTQLIVKDGQTVIMSGILRSEDSDVIRKVPGIGDVPLIGELFKSRERIKSTTELIAFITPLVVNSQADSDKVNEAPRSVSTNSARSSACPPARAWTRGRPRPMPASPPLKQRRRPTNARV